MKKYEGKTLLFEDLYGVFLSATSPSEGNTVAIWEYKQDLLSPKLIAHLSRLAERLMTLAHPNILTLIVSCYAICLKNHYYVDWWTTVWSIVLPIILLMQVLLTGILATAVLLRCTVPRIHFPIPVPIPYVFM